MFKDYETFKRVKEELKTLAKEIRKFKSWRKLDNRPKEWGQSSVDCRINGLKYDFRHKHIAYCLLRGTPRGKIECPEEHHLALESLICNYMKEWGMGQ